MTMEDGRALIEKLQKKIVEQNAAALSKVESESKQLPWYARTNALKWLEIVDPRHGLSISEAAEGALKQLAISEKKIYRNIAKIDVNVHVSFNDEFDTYVKALPGLFVVQEGVDHCDGRSSTYYAFWDRGFIYWDSAKESEETHETHEDDDLDLEDLDDEEPKSPSHIAEWRAAMALRDNRSVEVHSIDDDKVCADLVEMFNRHLPPPLPTVHANPGAAYLLCETMDGLSTIPIGRAATKLIRENYSPEAIAAYDFALADLKKQEPIGRLVILEGAPGGGKTHMVQAMMGDVPDSKFIVIPPKMVKDLEDPGFVLTFLREAGISHGVGSPVVLVLEDADQCLTERKSDNMSSISAILNLSDGIVGKMMNLRIVATTNTLLDDKSMRFDAAVLRKGRLSARIQIGKLSAKQANAVWERVAGEKKKPAYKSPQILADIYESAKQRVLEKNGAA